MRKYSLCINERVTVSATCPSLDVFIAQLNELGVLQTYPRLLSWLLEQLSARVSKRGHISSLVSCYEGTKFVLTTGAEGDV